MSRFSLSLLLVLILFWPASVFSSPAPNLAAEQLIFDFGEVFQGETVSHSFNFRNNGDAPLLIDRLKSSCGCTAAIISSKNIAPGEEGTIKATFDSTRFSGLIRKVIFLYSNLPGDARQFVLTGIVNPRVEFDPQQINFGEVREGETKQLRVVLTNRGEKVLKIENIRAANTALSAITDVTELLPGVATEFTVFAKPVKETAHLKGYILIRTDDANLGELRVPVTGLVGR